MVKYDYRLYYQLIYLNLVYVKDRIFYLNEDMQIVLSDGRTILIPKGFETDLSSIPQIFWGVFKPFDKGLLGDLIHDYLWQEKMTETLYFDSAFKAQLFSDRERDFWRKKLAKEFKIKNWITYKALRIWGGKRYRGEVKI